MTNKEFCHLHVHDEFSLLDGLGSCKDYALKAKELGFEYLALTNHGNVDGCIKFQDACFKQDISPVIGVEFYIVQDLSVKEKGEKKLHLTALAKNQKGIQNILKLLTLANTQGFYYKPRIDKKTLLNHIEGLIIMSACTSSFLLFNDIEFIKNIKERISRDFLLEIMPHNYKPQIEINKRCLELSRKLNIMLVATNDCHYVEEKGSKYQEVLLAIQTKKKWKDKDRWKFDIKGLHLKTADEMMATFKKQSLFSEDIYLPALRRTILIAKKCEGATIPKKEVELPKVYSHEHRDETELLIELVNKGLKKRIGKKIPIEYKERLDYELDLICKLGFQRYFLIVWELIDWCKKNDIMCGPGRGSVGASLLAYCLYITDVDPIKYNLIFARFISEARIDLPDIDMDFEDIKRPMIRKHLEDCYGKDNVCGVSTFLTLKGRAALRDSARVFDVPLVDVDKASKSIVVRSGGDFRTDFCIEDAFETFEDGKRFKEKYPEVSEVAMNLEGQKRGCLAGDTRMMMPDSHGGIKTKKIKNLYRDGYKGKIRSYDLSRKVFFFDDIVDIYESGEKEVYTLIATDSCQITLTKDHKLLSKVGWRKAEDFAIGDFVATNGVPWNKNLKKEDDSRIMFYSKKMQQSNPMHLKKNKMLVSKRSFKHGLYSDILPAYKCNHRICEICKEKFTEEIHHIDKNKYNNSMENLLAVCIKCHHKIHWAERSEKKINIANSSLTARWRKIIDISYAGVEMTYDISMKSKYQNFVANKVVTHNSGQHAAAICISKESLKEGERCNISVRKGIEVCNWDKYDCEHVGLMKLDVLGLSALTILNSARKMILENHNIDIDFDKIPLDDKKTLSEINQGNNTGAFQIGSLGLMKYCKQLGIHRFEDVVHATSLWRPGTLRSGMASEFVQRKLGENEVTYIHPRLKELTEDTFGIILYQEQVMQLMYNLGGLGWKTCDTIRKVISKSQGDALFAKFKDEFVEGCRNKKTLSANDAGRIWDSLSSFGCLTGDTIIYRASSNQYTNKELNIKEAYRYQNSDNFKNRKLKILSMDKDSFVRPNTINRIVKTGRKEVFFIRTASNKYIRATKDHRFLINNEWLKVGDAKRGDWIRCCDLKLPIKYTGKGEGRDSHGKSCPRFNKGKGITNERKNQKEKLINLFGEICNVCGSDLYVEMHHKDENTENNTDDNTTLLCRKHHRKAHDNSIFRRLQKGYYTQNEKIIEIKSVGKRETYDIEMINKPRNFIANNIVTHNSYSFNKAHAVEYSLITFWGMYLKTHYPKEFLCASLTYGNRDKKAELIEECKRLKLKIELPKIGASDIQQWIPHKTENVIYVPIIEIKGIGDKTAKLIYELKNKKMDGGFWVSKEKKPNKKIRKILEELDFFTTKTREEEIESIGGYFDFDLSSDPMRKFRKFCKLLSKKNILAQLCDIDFNKPDEKEKIYFGKVNEIKFGYRKNVQKASGKGLGEILGTSSDLGGVYGFFIDESDNAMLVFESGIYQSKKDTIEHCSGKHMLIKATHPKRTTNLFCHKVAIGEEVLNCEIEDFSLDLSKRIRYRNTEVLDCKHCNLSEECRSPVCHSPGLKNIMIVGEAPGKDEDIAKEGFVGKAGSQILWPELSEYSLSRDIFHVSNIVKCYPSQTRTPNKRQIKKCGDLWLRKEIGKVSPILILAFGNTSLKYFKEKDSGIMELNGTTEWVDEFGCWICWCIHPAAVLYSPENSELFKQGILNFAEKIKAITSVKVTNILSKNK